MPTYVGEHKPTDFLEPYHLVYYHGNWYVLARHIEKNRVATFAVSRFVSIETGDKFQMPFDFAVSNYIEPVFGIIGGEKKFNVRVLCSSRIAAYIKERVWKENQVIKERNDGSVELSFETAGWKELVRWILSWQPDMKVLAPKKLRDRVTEKMKMAICDVKDQ